MSAIRAGLERFPRLRIVVMSHRAGAELASDRRAREFGVLGLAVKAVKAVDWSWSWE